MSLKRIDTHAHFICPPYRKALLDNGHEKPDGIPYIPEWSEEAHLDFMDKHGIAKSILSTSSPGTHLVPGDDASACKLTREINEYASSLKSKYPDRFGFFATLPFPSVNDSLVEIDHALDVLNADGFMLLSNHHGVYLGDPEFRPVLEKLNARKAVVFVHPTEPCNRHIGPTTPSNRSLKSSPLSDAYMTPAFEFFFDSSRSFLDLILSGTATELSEIRWIVSHCGVALPSLLDRMVIMSRHNLPDYSARETKTISGEEVRSLLGRQFWFDLAGTCMPNQIHAILRWVGAERLVYGSDVPWTPFPAASQLSSLMEKELFSVVGKENVDAVYWRNAENLLRKSNAW